MGIGHMSPTVRRRLQAGAVGFASLAFVAAMGIGSGKVAATTTSSSTTIESITTNTCNGSASGGTLTVSGAVTGETITLGLYGKNPAGQFQFVGGTETINLVSGQSTYSYSIPLSSQAAAVKILRVQVVGTSGGSFDGTTTKGPSFQCGELSTPTPSATPTPTATPTPSGTPKP
jgi:hypothetical protein